MRSVTDMEVVMKEEAKDDRSEDRAAQPAVPGPGAVPHGRMVYWVYWVYCNNTATRGNICDILIYCNIW